MSHDRKKVGRGGRWAHLHERAAGLGQQLRVVVVSGLTVPGDAVTWSELPGGGDDSDLDATLDRVERYLESPEAARVAELLSRRNLATLTLEVGRAATRSALDGIAKVDDELDAISESNVLRSRAERAVREHLAGQEQDAARAATEAFAAAVERGDIQFASEEEPDREATREELDSFVAAVEAERRDEPATRTVRI